MADSRTSAERTLHARIGAYESWARTIDRSARTAPARQAFHDRFMAEVDEIDREHKLSDEQRAQMADAKRKAYYARLARQGLEARRAKAQKSNGAPVKGAVATDTGMQPDDSA